MRRLAEHHHDREIAGILNSKAADRHRTAVHAGARAGLRSAPGSPPPCRPIPTAAGDIQRAAGELGVSGATIRRWLKDGLLAGEQVTPQAPWRIRLSDETRRRFVPDVPAGYVRLDEAAKALGSPARPCCTKSNAASASDRGHQGRRKGLRIEVSSHEAGLFAQP